MADGMDMRTLVIDDGTEMIKAGFAGEDSPRAVIKSIVGLLVIVALRWKGDKEMPMLVMNLWLKEVVWF